jgi:hypothetical protein
VPSRAKTTVWLPASLRCSSTQTASPGCSRVVSAEGSKRNCVRPGRSPQRAGRRNRGNRRQRRKCERPTSGG